MWKSIQVCVDFIQLFVCLDSVECMRSVEHLQCVLSESSYIKQRFDLFLLITAVKDKRMQENLTLVVSWNVGENQVMQWAGVDCKPLGWHTETVRGSINNSLWPFNFLMFLTVIILIALYKYVPLISPLSVQKRNLRFECSGKKKWASA